MGELNDEEQCAGGQKACGACKHVGVEMDGVATSSSAVDPHRNGNARASPHCYSYSYDDGRPGVELVAEGWYRGVEVEASALVGREYVQEDVEKGEYRLFVCDRVYIVSYSNAR